VHHDQLRTATYHGPNKHLLAYRFNEHDVILTTYDTLRLDGAAEGPLYRQQWRRLILDEGLEFPLAINNTSLTVYLAHHVRSRASQTFKAACSIKSQHRWCLTGTPIHNSLHDYGALLSFLGIPGFTEKKIFENLVAKPIKENEPEGFARLQALVRGTCLRRTKESISHVLRLPQRQENIEHVYLDEHDQVLYEFFKARCASLASGIKTTDDTLAQSDDKQRGGIICLLNFLRSICNHGEQLLPDTALRIWDTRDQSVALPGEALMRDNDCDSPRYSAKVQALLRNLLIAHTPPNDISEQSIPAKR
jgi:SNF2 family DNA or RNA helicase